MYEADSKLNNWPPESFTSERISDPISITELENSLRYSIQTANQEHQIQQRIKRAGKMKKKFEATPMFPTIGTTADGGREVPERSDGTSLIDSPPSLIGGANGHGNDTDHAVNIDWLTMSGSRHSRMKALRLMESFFGESQPCKGKFFCDSGFKIGSGGVFFDTSPESNTQHCVVDIPGSLLSELNDLDLVQQFTTELTQIGFRATRVDIAVDTKTTPDLIPNALASCENGELTGARVFQEVKSTSKKGIQGHTLYVGKRGKNGSGRFLRIYDKGLETGTKTYGEWVRWESVLYSDCARQFIENLVDAKNTVEVCLAHAFGVCDFKASPEKKLSRRKRVQWFENFIGSIDPQRVRCSRVASTVYTKIRWVRDCVAPMLRTIQRCTRKNMDLVIEEITGPVKTREKYLDDTLVRSVVKSLGVDTTEIYRAYRSGGAAWTM